ncbi:MULTISPECIES: dihydrofolate reductase family protein [unclassified Mesobacillus]|jgi:dihydrofolate reductase|uniref:dihydrofolate reductase family protein n=1 Tax=unclassified Mesobacillus TaxID=2675270 RepID=UPI00203BA6F9|nr:MULTISPECIES: dihydrofolate reductase family protein [unclassified Mesobacillus]MCM3123644.1 dihydrofolate reductase family protein [Mesobacillus sp. MER 33]MCM3234341.1 dihydrofolate reductase family protein [Mesobacillus sp. MER 48]
MKNNKVILYIAMSLDGYIARPDGTVDWLDDVEGVGDNGYGKFYAQVGTVIMGRKTYEEVLKLTDEFPYADNDCYVLTRQSQESTPHVTFTDEDPETLVSRVKKVSDGYVWLVGGGVLVRQFLEKKLIDEIELYIIPKTIGEGIPLFPDGTPPSDWELASTGRYGQIAALNYKLKKGAE